MTYMMKSKWALGYICFISQFMMRNKIIPGCDNCYSCKDSVFGVLERKELEALNKHKSYHYYKKGLFIFYEGNEPDGIYCIYDGNVKISKIGDDGREQILRLARPGSFLGYRALLCNDKYNASAMALEDTHVCFFPKEFYMELLSTKPEIVGQTIKLLTNDLRFAENMMMNMAQKNVKGRIAEALLMLEEMYGVNEKDGAINISFKREDIGNMAGTTIETSIRVISELNREKIIELIGKKIKIIDRQRLVSLASNLSKR
jgi:CRP/FNR family transcriptional regulator, polysaccharide utilization system transcription regulator